MDTKLKVKLSGENGNVFNIIGICSKVLKRNGQREVATEFTEKCFNASSYDEVLMLCHEYFDVE